MTGMTIAEAGVYRMSAELYHGDPVEGGSLSSSGARKLLPPSCPARFHYEREHGQPPKRTFDIGHAAHLLVLGTGAELVVVDADSWRTKDAREQRDEAHARGATPILADEFTQVSAMADALRQHPFAASLFDPARGEAELALAWHDHPTGVWRRALLDWLPHRSDRRLIIPEYKTAVSSDPSELRRAVSSYGYHQQAAWNLAGAQALGLADDDAAFVFVCQEKHPPYIVTVVELDEVAMRIGDARNRRAMEIYAECAATGRWPGYSDDVVWLQLPTWVEIEDQETYL